ncbi:MAG TPA: RDD family protein [Chitinophagaceae bacterium]|nr:RDD family protein [Chitinophagaceae bacterium]
MKKVGIGTRVLNFVIDTLLVFFISWGFYKWHNFYVFYYQKTPIDFYIFFWLTLVVYCFLFEAFFSRTPGKWLTMSKVVDRHDKRPALWQVVVRSVVRVIPIDCFFIPFLDGTLHDFASNTKVVEA